MTRAMTVRRPGEAAGAGAGFSLIEVLVALALLAAVMLAISGLFAQGANTIKGGKEITEALTQGTDILEDMNELGYQGLYSTFGASGTDTAHTADSRDSASFANRWQPQIAEALWQGWAEIQLTPLGVDTYKTGCSSVTTPNFDCGVGIRLEVTLHWDERGRTRELPLSTVRF